MLTMLRSLGKTKNRERLLAYGLLALFSALFLLPFLWLLSSSFKTTEQIFAFPPQWLPRPFKWENYLNAVFYIPFFRYSLNTLGVCVAVVLGTVLSSTLVAYGFCRIKWPGRDKLFFLMLATMLLPPQVTMIPVFVMFRAMRVIDTYVPLILPAFLGAPFFIFLLRQFFRGIPEALSESARLDGCSEWRIYWNIIMPLSLPAISTVAIFAFIGGWVDFMGPLIYLQSPAKFTLSLGLQQFQTSHSLEWGMLMAASTLMVLPIILIFFVAQKAFIQGIATSGLKG